jgi:hypothetical protein
MPLSGASTTWTCHLANQHGVLGPPELVTMKTAWSLEENRLLGGSHNAFKRRKEKCFSLMISLPENEPNQRTISVIIQAVVFYCT